jgi:hypothetical protein
MAASLGLLPRTGKPGGRVAVPLLIGLTACGGGDQPSPSAPPRRPPPGKGAGSRMSTTWRPSCRDCIRTSTSRPRAASSTAWWRRCVRRRPPPPTTRSWRESCGSSPWRDTATPPCWRGFRYLPVALTRLADGLYLTSASGWFASSLGMRVVAIGGVPVAVLEARAAPFVSHENEAWLRVQDPPAPGDPRDAARARGHL